MKNLEQLLQKHFQYNNFRPGQKEIIQSVLEGKNVLGILPTGAGKTLCYHLPSKIIHGMTIVISPLLSLMEDQVHQLRARGEKHVVQLNGLMTNGEKNFVLRSLNEQSILYISPEMLQNRYVLSFLKKVPIGLFVVDEAHCISQWGHEFRPDYLRLKDVLRELAHPPCLALTATATKRVEKDIVEQLEMNDPIVHRFSVDRKNLSYFVHNVDTRSEKETKFFQLLQKVESPAIIYTPTRQEAERISSKMNDNGFKKTSYYHGGMGKDDRLLVQHQFLNGELDYICSTNAFGMGINKPDIRTIIHLHIPSSIEHYVQEVGRAGRDGQVSVAILIFAKDDRYIPLSLMENEYPTESELSVLFSTLQRMKKMGSIHVTDVFKLIFIEETKWRMLLYYLEQAGVIEKDELIMERFTKQVLNKLNVYFQMRKKEKQTQFYQFETLLTKNHCIREGILHHFEEKLTEKNDLCCIHCGLSLDFVLEKQREARMIQKDKEREQSWQEKLAAILLPHHGGKYIEK